jgi:hypothetical protein
VRSASISLPQEAFYVVDPDHPPPPPAMGGDSTSLPPLALAAVAGALVGFGAPRLYRRATAKSGGGADYKPMGRP